MLTNGDADANESAALQGWCGRRNEMADEDACCHGEQDPDDEEAVEEGKGLEWLNVGLGTCCWRCCDGCQLVRSVGKESKEAPWQSSARRR